MYQSVCSFNNREGGHLILGVEDKTKKILGIFIEANIFEIIIPLENVADLQVGPLGTQDGTQNGTQKKVIELIKMNPKVTRKQMAKELDISIRSLQRILNEMDGVHFVGRGINGHWEVRG